MTDDDQIFSRTNVHGIEVCITFQGFCNTNLSYKMGVLSYNCITFQGFCHTFLSYKIGVLSYKFKIEIFAQRAVVENMILSSYSISPHLYKMNQLEKKDKGAISESILYYIVIHFISGHILILFSSSSYYYYYYY